MPRGSRRRQQNDAVLKLHVKVIQAVPTQFTMGEAKNDRGEAKNAMPNRDISSVTINLYYTSEAGILQ